MRFLLALVFLACAGCVSSPPSSGSAVALTRVWPGWRDADSFTRISEYFTGQEATGREIVLRTHPADRAGYYFLLRLDHRGPALAGARVVIAVIAPDSPESRTYTFPLELRAGSSVYDLGITGADWPTAKAPAVAWKVDLQDATGAVLASRQSFLWAKPAP